MARILDAFEVAFCSIIGTKTQQKLTVPKKVHTKEFVLDRHDRAILRILQRDNKKPQRAIAEEVNLSAAAVQRRITAMEDAGIIAANVAVVDPEAVSATITAIVEVELENER